MSDPHAEARSKYERMAPAEALFFHLRNRHGTRVECPTLGLEFTDNTYIGSDPEGTLYFNNARDFYDPHAQTQERSQYKVYTQKYKDREYAVIKFWYANSQLADKGESEEYARFCGEDVTSTVVRSSMNNYTSSGAWNKLEIGSTTATVTKRSTTKTITLTAKPAKKKAVWTDSSSSLKSGHTVDVHGNLYYKDFDALVARGSIANYNNDRIVFYDSVNSIDFLGYFIPLEDETSNLGHQGGDDKEFTNVSWSVL